MKAGIVIFRGNSLKLYLGHKSFSSHVFSNFYLRLDNSCLYILGIVECPWDCDMVGTQRSVLICAEKPFDKKIGASASWGNSVSCSLTWLKLAVSVPAFTPSASMVGMCTNAGCTWKIFRQFYTSTLKILNNDLKYIITLQNLLFKE